MATLRSLSLAGILGLSVFAFTGGCSSDSDHHDRVSRSGGDDDVVLGRDIERAPNTAGKLPRDARSVDEGRNGGTLSYSSRGDGEVYLVDRSADTVIWDGKIRDGDRVTVDPGRNRIEINGREQANIDLKSNDRFQLYFLETGSHSRY
jgi:hypothetical protein